MKRETKYLGRRGLGSVSKDTKGSAGFHMEAQGLWTRPDLNG
jgi:hypothetical protein